jgi:hypothetical protein
MDRHSCPVSSRRTDLTKDGGIEYVAHSKYSSVRTVKGKHDFPGSCHPRGSSQPIIAADGYSVLLVPNSLFGGTHILKCL